MKTPMGYAVDGHNDIFVVLFEEFCEDFYRRLLDDPNISKLANHYARYVRANQKTELPLLDLALIQAIKKGKVGVAMFLLDEGADPDCKDDEKIPALHLAAGKGLARVMHRLLQGTGASCDPLDSKEKTPLDYAQEAVHKEAEDLLKTFMLTV